MSIDTGFPAANRGTFPFVFVLRTVNQVTSELQKPQWTVGKVTDFDTGHPVGEFTVEKAFENVAGEPDGLYWADKTPGRNGKYRKQITLPSLNRRYTYRVRAEGYQSAVSPSVRINEGETRIDFVLKRLKGDRNTD